MSTYPTKTRNNRFNNPLSTRCEQSTKVAWKILFFPFLPSLFFFPFTFVTLSLSRQSSIEHEENSIRQEEHRDHERDLVKKKKNENRKRERIAIKYLYLYLHFKSRNSAPPIHDASRLLIAEAHPRYHSSCPRYIDYKSSSFSLFSCLCYRLKRDWLI